MPRPTKSRSEVERVALRYGHIKRRIEQVKKLLSEVDNANPLDIKKLKVGIIELDKDIVILKEILEAPPENIEQALYEEINANLESAFEIKAKAELVVERFKTISVQSTNSPAASLISHTGIVANNPSIDNNYRILTVQLLWFGGQHEEWPNFVDAFQSVIEKNSELRDIQKFSYLKSCLSGPAAEKIRALEITADNYPIAWKTLTDYYNDPLILINKHVQAILEGPPINDDFPESLIAASDALNANYGSLLTTKKSFVDQFTISAHFSRVNSATRLRWEEQRSRDTLPTVEEFVVFLRERGKALLITKSTERNRRIERMNAPTKPDRIQLRSRRTLRNEPIFNSPRNWLRNTDRRRQQPLQAYSTRVPILCGIFRDRHHTTECEQLLRAEPEVRKKIVVNANLCLNCLQAGHRFNVCKKDRCRKCKGGHHELLHIRETVAASATVGTTSNCIQGALRMQDAQVRLSHSQAPALLLTAVVHLLDRDGRPHECRVLLDSGSEAHFLTIRFANLLRIATQDVDVPISGLNQTRTKVSQAIETIMKSRTEDYAIRLKFLLLPTVTNRLPAQRIPREELVIPAGIQLADPEFHQPTNSRDAILGIEIFASLWRSGQTIRLSDGLIAQKTVLGWLVMNAGTTHIPQSVSCPSSYNHN
ncbi:uncharacterized protein LOC122513530 [Polistes fuscatus]|uniref:uncharacterized protein LOC122513530 n=1 Tax=Polistes fuscatus TaxID=30207 RepID=UPI001CA89960|nr:uncharacterized protein LOC122513530 [Polistes fuscatus]